MTGHDVFDSDHMVVVPHTPREDALRRDYATYLREVDNPVFNRAPGVVHYSNWRVCAPTPAVPFTNIDFLRVESEAAAAELAVNVDLAEHAASWTEMWGRYPEAAAEDTHLNGHLYLCRRVAGHRVKTRYVSLEPSWDEPSSTSGDAEVWQVTMPVTGDARFNYLRLVPLPDPVAFGSVKARLPRECFGAALAELIAAPDAEWAEIDRRETAADEVAASSSIHHRIQESRAAIGSNPAVVWAIKHVVSPIDRLVVRVGGGRIPPLTSLAVPTLLLTTVGRKSGLERTTPLVFVPDDGRYLVANARPAGERRNPWVLNLRAAGRGRVHHRRRSVDVTARELDETEIEEWWPKMVKVWPAFADHYANTGERTMFSLEPDSEGGA